MARTHREPSFTSLKHSVTAFLELLDNVNMCIPKRRVTLALLVNLALARDRSRSKAYTCMCM